MSNEASLVLKFGGSSVGTPQRIAEVVRIVKSHPRFHSIVAVVVSAFQGVTDTLHSLARQAASRDNQWISDVAPLFSRHREAALFLTDGAIPRKLAIHLDQCEGEVRRLLNEIESSEDASKAMLDELLSYGERLSVQIVAEAFRRQGIAARGIDARGVIKTDEHFGRAGVLFDQTASLIRETWTRNEGLPIVTGFIGSTIKGATTTLGRGGSDYTATILAAALGNCAAEIWTDTDGVMTADPKRVPHARTVGHLTYEEAELLFKAGALVVYPPTVDPARRNKLTVTVRNTFHPDEPGTVIDGDEEPTSLPRSVASRNSTVLCTLRIDGRSQTSLRDLVERLVPETSLVSVHLPSSHRGHGLAVHTEDSEQLRRLQLVDEIAVTPSCAIVTVVGTGISNAFVERQGIKLLSSRHVSILGTVSGTGKSAGFVVPSEHEQRAVEILHELIPVGEEK